MFDRRFEKGEPSEQQAEFICEAGPPYKEVSKERVRGTGTGCAEEGVLDLLNNLLNKGIMCSYSAQGTPCPHSQRGNKTKPCTRKVTITWKE